MRFCLLACRGVALAFAELGARIAICDINTKGAEEVRRLNRILSDCRL